jgi:hypothetical protein
MNMVSEMARGALDARAPRARPIFPPVAWIHDRGYVFRSHLNRYKAELVGEALGAEVLSAALGPMPPVPDGDPLLPLKQVAAKLGIHRRTVGRLIVESGRGIGRRHAGTPRVQAEPQPAATEAA